MYKQVKHIFAYCLPKFMLRPTAPKNPVPVKENILDLNCLPGSPSAEAYMIPALEINSATTEIKMWIDHKQFWHSCKFFFISS